MLVQIRHKGQQLGIFGFNVCNAQELGTAILCRACELMRCSMVDPVLHECFGDVKPREGGLEAHFQFDEERYTFKEI